MMQRALSSCARTSRAIRAVSSSGRRVAVIYGSFCKHRESQTDADVIARALAAEGLEVSEPVEGVAGAWESAARADALVVCTSTRLGLPPENLAPFADALVGAAGDGAAPLGHLRHAVFGNGHENWLSTFMNAPRAIDALLEACGSSRAFARGEANEPCAPLGADQCRVRDWAPACARALAGALGGGDAPAVSHGALWATAASPFHHEFQVWNRSHLRAFYPELDPAYTPPAGDAERHLRRRVARDARVRLLSEAQGRKPTW